MRRNAVAPDHDLLLRRLFDRAVYSTLKAAEPVSVAHCALLSATEAPRGVRVRAAGAQAPFWCCVVALLAGAPASSFFLRGTLNAGRRPVGAPDIFARYFLPADMLARGRPLARGAEFEPGYS